VDRKPVIADRPDGLRYANSAVAARYTQHMQNGGLSIPSADIFHRLEKSLRYLESPRNFGRLNLVLNFLAWPEAEELRSTADSRRGHA